MEFDFSSYLLDLSILFILKYGGSCNEPREVNAVYNRMEQLLDLEMLLSKLQLQCPVKWMSISHSVLHTNYGFFH